MTSYLVYSTVAQKWNRKIQCENSCRWISLPLYLVWERRSRTSFFGKTPLPASNNIWTKVQLSTKPDAVISTIILLSLIFFFNLHYNICNGRVSCKKLNGWEFGHWLTANFTFPAVTWKNIVWSFSTPLWCNKHLPGQSSSIIIAFEFFGMFVSTRTPSVLSWTVVLVFEIMNCFSMFKLFSMVKWLWQSTAFFVNNLWLIVCNWWAGIFVNIFRHFW